MRLKPGPATGRSDLRSMPTESNHPTKSSMLPSKRQTLIFIALVATGFYFAIQSPISWFSSSASAHRPPPPPCADSAPRVTVKNGTLCGIHSNSYNQDFFLGVPYSKPPLNELRFRRAQSLDTSWKEDQPATEYPLHCVGYGHDREDYPFSEDCLYLNIVKPRKPKGKKKHDWKNLPVAVWIHGGALIMGGTADRRYNLSFIVQEGVNISKPFIGVSINYRVAAWGFLTGNELLKRGETNNGILDQRLALHWIQENIAAFGGDPKKVTIWGQSAGGTSVGQHITAYGGRDDGLFRAAVLESAGGVFNRPYRPIEEFESLYQDVLKEASCQNARDTVKCLQKLSFNKLDKIFAVKPHAWKPIVDNDFITDYSTNQAETGDFVKVPIIAGDNTDEGTVFTEKGIDDPDRFEKMVHNRFVNELVDKVLVAYPDDPCFGTPDLGCERLGDPFGGQFRRISAFDGDFMFIAHRRLMCEMWAKAGLPAYCYRFNARAAGVAREVGVPHITEVAFVFSNVNGVGFEPPRTPPFQGRGPEYPQLAQFMSWTWASFFVDMDPNSFRGQLNNNEKDIPGWPKYDDSKSLFLFEPASQSHMDSLCCGIEKDNFREEGINLINQNNAQRTV